MTKAIMRRTVEFLITLICATLLIFTLTRLAPGDPVKLRYGQTLEAALGDMDDYERRLDEKREELGLNDNLAVQYLSWFKRLVKLDLGNSIHTGRPVRTEIAERQPATFILALSAFLLEIVAGLVFGVLSALHAGRPLDTVIMFACIFFASIPGFVTGLVLLSVFGVTLHIYEIRGTLSLSRLWLPALTLALVCASQLVRIVRANMLEEFGKTYIITAISKGLSKRKIIRHALRNALLPIATILTLSLTSLIGGVVVIEAIFSWPGLGKYALDSVLLRDYPVIQGYAFVMVSIIMILNLSLDLLYLVIDPRIRYRYGVFQKKWDMKPCPE